MPKKVGQDFESRLNDSGIGNAPGYEGDALSTGRVGPGTPYFQDCRPTSSSQDCSPVKSEFPMSAYRERSGSRPSFKRILFICSLFALVGCCLLYKAWTSFQIKEIVWRSYEHVTISLASVASVILLLIIIVSWKYARTSCGANDEVIEIYQGSNFGYFGGEATRSPRGTDQEPNVVGQRKPDAPNEGQGSSLGIGHNFELPFADATPVSSPIKRT